MNNKVPLKIFSTSYLQQLKDSTQNDNETVLRYLAENVTFEENGILKTRVEVSEQYPNLNSSASSDAENAIKVYEYLGGLDESAACDERVWSYLAHVPFRSYLIGRWPIAITKESVKVEDIKNKSVISINDHWFYGQRGMVRNGIARLWWGAQATVAPWEKGDDDDVKFYENLDKSDRFRYTKLLFSKAVIYQQIMEREPTRHPRIRATLLEYIYDNQDITKDQIGNIAKRIDMANSYRRLDTMDYMELRSIIDSFAGFQNARSSEITDTELSKA